MKPINVVTSAGIKSLVPKKRFSHLGFDFAIVEKPEWYLNSTEPMYLKRVIEVKTGMEIPVYNLQRKDTLKSIMDKTIDLLDSFVDRGANLMHEISQYETINP